MEIDGLTLEYAKVPRFYARCFLDSCPRAAECMHYSVGQCAPDKPATGTCVFPQSMNAEGGCPYFRPKRVIRSAWGFNSLFRDVLARDSVSLRRELIRYFKSRSTYYRYNRGQQLLTPGQQQEVLDIFARFGYDPETLSFDHYIKEIAFF